MRNSIDAEKLVKTKTQINIAGGRAYRVYKSEETEEQAALIQWAQLTIINGLRISDYLIHIPNEAKRGPKAARDAKRLGVKAGVSDLFLAIPNKQYAGLWIEMKSKKGKVTETQKEWIERMIDIGYQAVVCYSFEKAKLALLEFINVQKL